jgi:hypothetical protein
MPPKKDCFVGDFESFLMLFERRLLPPLYPKPNKWKNYEPKPGNIFENARNKKNPDILSSKLPLQPGFSGEL